jgi:pSer/pThr/pTyr-binding forkhead associated (FHA) protein
LPIGGELRAHASGCRTESPGESGNQKVNNRGCDEPPTAGDHRPERGVSYPIATDSFTIGRDPQNQLSLADRSASREHCVILRQGDDFVIRDLGSFHGTLVNDARVTERVLANGDCIKIGKSLLRFLTEEALVCEETSEDVHVIEIPFGQAQLPAVLENSRDSHTLLRMSIMLHSFHALYKTRRSPARRTLERHLLEFIFEAIPASRGAILLYDEDLSEPSLLSLGTAEAASEESAPPAGGHQPDFSPARHRRTAAD